MKKITSILSLVIKKRAITNSLKLLKKLKIFLIEVWKKTEMDALRQLMIDFLRE